jgi:quinolinate synthase
VADFVGDSLGLSYQAAKTDTEVILFCGVHFMAETAKIINPTKRVVLPDLDAGCSLSESCPPPALAAFLKKNADKNYYVIAYINCSAGVKALSDVICTSGNAEKIVKAAPPDRNILFVPDQNLGAWVMERTGRKMDLWRGTCYVHVEFTARSIRKIREQHPGADVLRQQPNRHGVSGLGGPRHAAVQCEPLLSKREWSCRSDELASHSIREERRLDQVSLL